MDNAGIWEVVKKQIARQVKTFVVMYKVVLISLKVYNAEPGNVVKE